MNYRTLRLQKIGIVCGAEELPVRSGEDSIPFQTPSPAYHPLGGNVVGVSTARFDSFMLLGSQL